jgi:hypothetical protein
MTQLVLNENFHLKDSGYSNTGNSLDLPRHRWYFFKEAFSPYLVEKAIEDKGCNTDDLIVDPFCGSGTVPLTSSLKGHKAIGVEVNPFLAFVSRAKLIQVASESLYRSLSAVMRAAKKGRRSDLETFSTFSEDGGESKWLFNQPVLRAFEGGWRESYMLYAPVKNLIRLALIGAAMDSCNAITDGKCLRYREKWKQLKLGKDEFLASFENRVKNIAEDLKVNPNGHDTGKVILGDSRKVLDESLPNRFKLCVTSPPYLNSFDYTDVYRPELFLGKFVKTQEQLYNLRFGTMRSHVQVKWELPTVDAFGTRYQESVEQIRQRSDLLWNKRIPQMIQAYFEDMRKILIALKRKAADDAKVWIVVSTSAYAGVEVPVDLIIADIGSQTGWFLQEVGVIRYLRSSGQHWKKLSIPSAQKPKLRESVVILSASPSSALTVL